MGVVKRFAVINNGEVHNVILAEDGFKLPGFELRELREGERVSPGDLWDGAQFVQKPVEEHKAITEEDIAARIAALEEEIQTLKARLEQA